jgi:streptogramin lyase
MTDLNERFQTLSRMTGPDLWPEIEAREPRVPADHGIGRRIAVAASALALAAGGATLAARAFLGEERADRPPVRPAASPAAPVEPVVDVTLPIRWPSSVVYGEGSVWIAASANDGTGAGTVYRIDPDTAEILAEIPVAAVPGWETGGGAMEVTGGAVWVAGGGSSRNLVRIDVATNRVDLEIAVEGASLGDVAVDDLGVWVSVFVRDGDHESIDLVRLDPVTGAEEARIPLEREYGREVIAIDGTIWVHEHETHGSVVGTSVLTRVDPHTGRVVASVPLGSSATSVTEGNGFIWAPTWTSEEGNRLLRLDPRTNELTRIPSDDLEFVIAVGEGGIWGVVRRGRDLSGERGGIVRFDPITNRVDAGVDLQGGAIAMAVAPGSIWVVHYGEGVTRVELRPA